ncbi:MAG: glycerate kinase, partial [Verrucomicrobiota bacterium]
MRVLIACDKFKGSLSAPEVASAIERGLGEGFECELCPIADGGEGFVEAMVGAMDGEVVECEVSDALGRPVEASYGICGKTAVIEMAAASGLWRIDEGERDVLDSSTVGTGELMLDAIQRGAEMILLGLGGSATNDGGAGMAAALGWSFFGKGDVFIEVPTPSALAGLEGVDGGASVELPEIQVACDVENPLLGERGATAIFGPQKGAGPEEREFLESVLMRLMEVTGGECLAEVPGAGAAGGLGWGLMQFADAQLRPGFEMVADAIGLQERIEAADVVITGEGSLDGQSLEGKGPIGVARMAVEAGKPVYAIAGQISEEVRGAELLAGFRALADTGLPLEELIGRAGEL